MPLFYPGFAGGSEGIFTCSAHYPNPNVIHGGVSRPTKSRSGLGKRQGLVLGSRSFRDRSNLTGRVPAGRCPADCAGSQGLELPKFERWLWVDLCHPCIHSGDPAKVSDSLL